jgi:glutamine---fructose-6-phosphate transaminase (isomerizing)
MAVLTENNIRLINDLGETVEREAFHVTWDIEAAEKGGYPHFMLKEIHEQPKAVRDTLSPRIDENNHITLDEIRLTPEELNHFNKVTIVACGTAMHAGLVGKYAIEKFARIPVEVEIASEFRYKDPFVDERTLLIAVSQSGETADTLAAVREAKSKGAHVLTVTNVVGSRISREADDIFYTWAGPEIAVASTKAYITQVVALNLIALFMAETKGVMTKEQVAEKVAGLKELPNKIQEILDDHDIVKEQAYKQFNQQSVFFIGRGIDDLTSKEGSLKLKEISYVHSESVAAGELKHGTIALLEEGTLIIALSTQDYLYDKMLSNMKEVKARGAFVVAVAEQKRKDEVQLSADVVLPIPDTHNEFTPVLSVVPLQLFAYYMAVARGADVDKPKNLAKSVTVE